MSQDPMMRTRLEQHLDELPVLPAVVVQLMTLDRGAEDYPDQVEELIAAEPNFSARVIAAANSAASAPASPITTLSAAIARVGSSHACDLVLAVGVTQVFVPRDVWERSLWRHALQVAVASRALAARAREPRLDPAEAYTAGLLHDVGRFVMFQEAPDQLREIDEGGWETATALIEMETGICGMNHAELGALACDKWGIPSPIAEVVEGHHSPPSNATDAAGRLTSIVHVADLAMFPSAMATTDGYAESDEATIGRELVPRLPADVAMDAADLRRIIIDVTAEAEATLGLVGLA